MSYAFEEDEIREEAAQKLRRWIFWSVALLLGVSAGGYFLLNPPKKAPTRRSMEPITIVSLPPPPPPPPKREPEPPKPEEPREEPQQQEMVMQEPVPEDEPPAAESPPQAPVGDIGTGITGNGPADAFGLSGRGSGMRIGGGGGGSKGSRYGWYAAQVQKRVAAVLRAHPLLRMAEFRPTNVRIYADSTGRAIRVSLDSTGNPQIDQAIREALTGAQVTDAMLGDKPLPPMPIVMRLKAVRPN